MRKGVLIGCMAVIMGCTLVGCDARPHYADENNNDQITDFNQINEALWYMIQQQRLFIIILMVGFCVRISVKTGNTASMKMVK